MLVVSGTGIFACQMAKNVFKAGKVITTVSTSKIDKVAELLGKGVVDQSMRFQVAGNNFYTANCIVKQSLTTQPPTSLRSSKSTLWILSLILLAKQ